MRKILLFLLFSTYLFGADATMSVINQSVALPRLAIKDNSTLEDVALLDRFRKFLLSDLRVSADFELLGEQNDLKSWLFNYSLTRSDDGIILDVWLEDSSKQSVFKRSYKSSDEQRFIFLAHKSVVDLVDFFKLSPVNWMDRFILLSRYTSKGESEIVLSDYTLSYEKVIIKGGLNIFPKWANNEQSAFYYTAYVKNRPTLFYYDLKNGKKSKILQSDGMLVVSDISADGDRLLLSMAPKDNADIFLYNKNSGKLSQLSSYGGVDVSAKFIDDEKRVAFISDRLGYPSIFAMPLNGSEIEQLVSRSKNSSSLSTYKNYVAYASRQESEFGNDFNIFLISTKTDYVRQLTANGKNTYPRFSNDGGSVVFIKQTQNQSNLGVIRLNENKSFLFPLKLGRIQSIDW